jgi:hypothetical protein
MAYNPEDVGSKPTAGNISICLFFRNKPSYAKRRKTQQTYFTGMAQRKRAGLITPRSLDRNGLPVFFHFASFKETSRQAGRKTQ